MGVLQQTAASRTKRAFDEISAAAHCLSPGRVFWKPLGKGVDALQLLAECSEQCAHWAEVIEKRKFVQTPEDLVQDRIKRLDTLDKALEQLDEDVRWFLSVVRSIPDDLLGSMIEVPTGQRTLAECMFNPLWCLGYHEAQITYIQSLCQD